MADLFASGRIVDLILLLMMAELVALIVYNRQTSGGGLALPDALAVLVPGACLLLALRASLTGGAWTPIALWLVLAFAAHLIDLCRRLRRG